MGFNIEDTKGNVKATQNIYDGEVDKETLDFSIKNTYKDVTVLQEIRNVKSKKAWVYISLAIIAALAASYKVYIEFKQPIKTEITK